jgi:predicted component of type VI protein secretion system
MSHIPNWKDGDVLSARHLQVFNETVQDLASRSFVVHKYDYGVQECVLDTSRLQDGIVSLKKLVGVFPDGVSIDQECSIEVEIEEAQSVFVYAAIVERDGAPTDRYVRYTAQVKDYYSTDISYLQCLQYKIYLFARSAPPDGYVSMPIARITNKKVDKNYMPPVLMVEKNRYLLALVKFLRDKLEGINHEHYVFIVLLESMLEIEAMIKNQASHPFMIYLALVRLLGKSAAFCHNKTIPAYVEYDHLDIHRVYDRIGTQVKKNLHWIRDVTSEVLAYQDGKFVIKLEPEHLFSRDVIALSLEFTNQTHAEMAKWADTAVIEGLGAVASLERVLGAPRGITNRIDQVGLEERGNTLLLIVGVDGTYLAPRDYMYIHNPSTALQGPSCIKLFYHGSQNFNQL